MYFSSTSISTKLLKHHNVFIIYWFSSKLFTNNCINVKKTSLTWKGFINVFEDFIISPIIQIVWLTSSRRFDSINSNKIVFRLSDINVLMWACVFLQIFVMHFKLSNYLKIIKLFTFISSFSCFVKFIKLSNNSSSFFDSSSNFKIIIGLSIRNFLKSINVLSKTSSSMFSVFRMLILFSRENSFN